MPVGRAVPLKAAPVGAPALKADAATLKKLNSAPEVDSIKEDVRLRLQLADSTPLVGAPQAWDAGYGGKEDVPDYIKHLILVVLKEAYDNREPVVTANMMRSPAFTGLFSAAAWPSVA